MARNRDFDRKVMAKAYSAEHYVSQNGTKAVRVVFDLAEPLRRYDGGSVEQLTDDIWITRGAANMAHKKLKSLGVDSDTVNPDAFRERINQLIAGAEVELVVVEEPPNKYHSTPLWKVLFINAPDGGSDDRDPLEILRSRPRREDEKDQSQGQLPLDRKSEAQLPADTTPAGYDDDVPF